MVQKVWSQSHGGLVADRTTYHRSKNPKEKGDVQDLVIGFLATAF